MKTDIICHMRLFAALLLVPAAALGVVVEPLPPPEFADAEVSTNLPFVVSLDSMSRLEFTLSLDASLTTCVEASIGTDANGDGNLSLDEADYTVGYRCGVWFLRDAVRDMEVDEEVEIVGGGGQRRERLFVLKKRNLDPAWNLVKVTRRGVAEIGEVVAVDGKQPGFGVMVR